MPRDPADEGLLRVLRDDGTADPATDPGLPAERCVELSMWLVTAYEGEPMSLDGQALKWVKPADLANEDLLEADRPIVAALMDRAATSSPSGSRQKIS